MKSLELFSGAGGLARGLEMSGFVHEGFVEFNKHACSSLSRNFNAEIVHHVDVRNFDFSGIKNIDIIAGGPPCQPFSLGGKHSGNLDLRDMFPHAVKSVRILLPKAFLFENVKGLLRDSFSTYFEYIILRLTFPDITCEDGEAWNSHLGRLRKEKFRSHTGIKYNVKFKLLNAANYGIPQIRERVVIVGIRSDIEGEWDFPPATHSKKALEWDMTNSGEYWRRHRITSRMANKIMGSMENRSRSQEAPYGFLEPELSPWTTVRDAIGDLPDPQSAHQLLDHKFQGGAKAYPGHTGSDLDWPSKTIKAGGHGVPGGENMIRYPDGHLRYFSILEAKRIQTFPDDFFICGAWGEAMRQIGNAVPVKLGRVLGESLVTHLKPKKMKAC